MLFQVSFPVEHPVTLRTAEPLFFLVNPLDVILEALWIREDFVALLAGVVNLGSCSVAVDGLLVPIECRSGFVSFPANRTANEIFHHVNVADVTIDLRDGLVTSVTSIAVKPAVLLSYLLRSLLYFALFEFCLG